MCKEYLKMTKEEYQEYLKFKKRQGGVSKIKKGKGSYSRKNNKCQDITEYDYKKE